jgi:glycosyltransferase involved in cell wall biosynthesis
VIRFIGRVGSVERGNLRSAGDVVDALRELGLRVKVLGAYRKNKRLKSSLIGILNRLRRLTSAATIVNGLGGMQIYDGCYSALKADVLIVRESPSHFQLKGADPRALIPLMERFRKIVFVSSIARGKWQALGLRDKETFYLPNTVRDAAHPPEDADALPPRSSRLVVLIVGSFQLRKAQDVVVEAVLESAVLRENYRFVFIGGLENEYARSLVQRSERCDALVFLGKRDASAYYPKADIVLQPSRAEAMSRVVLEAMKCKRPLVCTDIEGNAEVVDHMVNGILIPPDDREKMVEALEHMRHHPAEREAMAEAARATFEAHYSWEHYRKRWERFVRDNLAR